MKQPEIKVARSSDIKEGKKLALTVNGKKIVLIRHRGNLFVLSNVCPHQGAPLSDGVTDNGHIVCKYHGWRFRLQDGSFSGNPNLKIATYAVSEREDCVYVCLQGKAR